MLIVEIHRNTALVALERIAFIGMKLSTTCP